jgi:2,4-dienoyl-CoA reductase-like NADH-dependent reductase (Old Yellow Enzyme family)/thioredoxin reductase
MLVKNRIEFAPAGPFLATSDSHTSRELIEWGKQFARGGAGIVTLGSSAVVPADLTKPGYAIHLGTDKAINPLNRFAEAIQRYGARASVQLNYHTQRGPGEMTREEIHQIIESYAQAAFRCLKAGMDMVQVHGAHGQILSQFFNPKINSRTDEFGGTAQNRASFAISILEAIRNLVGDRLAIEYRISADELVSGGLTLEDNLAFAKLIQDHVDLIHVSIGHLWVQDTMPMMNQPTYFPRGLNIPYAARYKQELKVPIAVVGGFNMDEADQIIEQRKADIVAMVRTLIADPDCVNKTRRGYSYQVRPCVRCNYCINRTHYTWLSVRCAVNPVIGREVEFANPALAVHKKKVVIVGGGPAGMEAARQAAERGHSVVLLEKEGQLGGSLIMASAAPFKTYMQEYLDWAIRETLRRPEIQVKLNTEATPAVIRAEHPDALIIAVGSIPIKPRIPGADRPNVIWAGDVDLNKVPIGNRVVIAGAGLTGSETGLALAQQGKQVTLIDMLPLEQIDAGTPVINIYALRRLLKELKVATLTEVRLVEITANGARVVDKNGRSLELVCDTLIYSLGVEPRANAIANLQGLVPEVYLIGDCNNQRGNLCSAVAEGFFAAQEI